MNKIILAGRIVNDIEIKKSKSEKEYTTFTVAVKRKLDKDKTDFIDCVAFGNLVQPLSKYVGKGNRIIVEGELNINDFENKEGQKQRGFNVVVKDFYFVDFKENQQTEITE